jgi:hypothetical protein
LWTVVLFGFFPPAVLLVICAVDQSELEKKRKVRE